MDILITPKKLAGTVHILPSKSQAHRILICAAFADTTTILHCPQTNRDIEATASCLTQLGACIQRTDFGYIVEPVRSVPKHAELHCHDSGSTLRFMLPIAGALGVDATFHMEGRLPSRPLSPLWEVMETHGCSLSRPTEHTIRCQGALKAGIYSIDGGISSQFITGLLFAASLIPGESQIQITGTVESRPYIDMTLQAMALFGKNAEDFCISGSLPYHSPGEVTIEGDWSNGAFFLASQTLGNAVQVENLSSQSCQGDRVVAGLLSDLTNHITISAADIPDLVPILSIAAACRNGASFTNIRRLRLKESDRVASVISMIQALGGRAEADENTLIVYPAKLTGGIVDSVNDHRIAMSAAIAATVCTKTVTILGAQCVEKSYPHFWEEYRRLGGCYEQRIR